MSGVSKVLKWHYLNMYIQTLIQYVDENLNVLIWTETGFVDFWDRLSFSCDFVQLF